MKKAEVVFREGGELKGGQSSGSAESIVPQFVFGCVCVACG